jgi:hypothetical protein
MKKKLHKSVHFTHLCTIYAAFLNNMQGRLILIPLLNGAKLILIRGQTQLVAGAWSRYSTTLTG